MRITDLATPAVLIEKRRVERNLDRMQAAVSARGIQLRPHAKTHKSPLFAQWQLRRGAVGICCAKLGEAEVFADAGVQDIRLPYPLNPVNAPRVVSLMDRTHVSFIVDHVAVARGWSEAMQRAGRSVCVLVKVDVGFHRCGIDPAAEGAAELVAHVARLPALNFRGLLSHAGHGYGAGSAEEAEAIAREEVRVLTELASRVRALGVDVPEISVGATPTARFSVQQDGVTEMRPGNYIYFDRTQVGLGAAGWEDCALTVLARVVTRPAPDRVILDCGSKTLTTDAARGWGNAAGYGAIMQDLDARAPDDDLVIERLSEEHATVRAPATATLQPGDLVRIVPNHSCVVTNLMDAVWLVDGDHALERVPITARGRIT